MRHTILALVVTLATTATSAAQPPADAHPYGLDPYKPSDAALLRSYGATLVSQTPLPELGKLDPYKPSHAALLRQLGSGLPLWGLSWFPLQAPGPVMPLLHTAPASPITVVLEDRRASHAVRDDAADAELPAPYWMATLRSPESNDGVWITYAGRKWIASGKAVPFETSAFERVGGYGTFSVYKRTRPADDLIYLPTRDGLVAPYRAKN